MDKKTGGDPGEDRRPSGRALGAASGGNAKPVRRLGFKCKYPANWFTKGLQPIVLRSRGR